MPQAQISHKSAPNPCKSGPITSKSAPNTRKSAPNTRKSALNPRKSPPNHYIKRTKHQTTKFTKNSKVHKIAPIAPASNHCASHTQSALNPCKATTIQSNQYTQTLTNPPVLPEKPPEEGNSLTANAFHSKHKSVISHNKRKRTFLISAY